MSMQLKASLAPLVNWVCGLIVFAVGVLNMMLVHPVPAVGYMLVSLVYFPPTNNLLREKTGLSIPLIVKIGLGVILVMFTLGVSDLGDMID
ncbi:hypothetical protein LJY25_08660 [Hymenobacter sp. BT175]|uniref:hypothetical protein n=1 Tax=Hymenobacter translucens TaxID=2886507 RepID=UPI001D0ED951|nr:hypothetical protein [Hymenobacter translucens]MCC2546512.1 hypothetical protein [Hymenobacter translucens]